jgi:hypothetical protein
VHDHVDGRVLLHADFKPCATKGCSYRPRDGTINGSHVPAIMYSGQVPLEVGDQDFDKIVWSAACKSGG